ncbi:MAG: two-component system, cell cycle response regulator [Anaerophaga sp.]|nr:two-component system, cell cycle response regulator [Anaerophaga sp.]
MSSDEKVTIETMNEERRGQMTDPFEDGIIALKEKLELANSVLKAVLETSHDFMIFGLDTRYCYLSFNNRHREVMKSQWGVTIQIGSKILDLMDSFEERETIKGFCDRALAGEQFVSVEEYKDNGETYVLGKNYWAPIKDNSNRIIGVVCFIQDVTEKREALKAMLAEGGEKNKIESMSFRDPLTGIYNKAFYELEIKKMDNSKQYPLSIILVEINGLHELNSRYGHVVGDDFIKKAAYILDNGCRGDDVVARFSEGQFVIIMPKTEGARVERAIERIRKMLEEVKIKSIKLSVSFGFGTKYEDDETIQDIFNQAERFLERQKKLL